MPPPKKLPSVSKAPAVPPRRPAAAPSLRMNRTSPSPRDEAAPEPGSASAESERSDNVDKIRDILFGTQMRDYDKRMARVEERLVQETLDLREDGKRRCDALETFVKAEFDAFGDRLKAEQEERADADKETARELRETTKALEKRLAQIEEQATRAQRELRDTLLQETKRLAEAIARSQADTLARLEKESLELRTLLTDRLALADLFAEVSLRLKREFKVPGQE